MTEDDFAAGQPFSTKLTITAKYQPSDTVRPGEEPHGMLVISSDGDYGAAHGVTEKEARAWFARQTPRA